MAGDHTSVWDLTSLDPVFISVALFHLGSVCVGAGGVFAVGRRHQEVALTEFTFLVLMSADPIGMASSPLWETSSTSGSLGGSVRRL